MSRNEITTVEYTCDAQGCSSRVTCSDHKGIRAHYDDNFVEPIDTPKDWLVATAGMMLSGPMSTDGRSSRRSIHACSKECLKRALVEYVERESQL